MQNTTQELAEIYRAEKITQGQLGSILINGGIIQAAAIEDPDGYDGGKIALAVTNATQQINGLLIKAPKALSETCDWTENETHGYWEGACGLAWEFTTGTPATNGFWCCPRCGRRVHTANDKIRRVAD